MHNEICGSCSKDHTLVNGEFLRFCGQLIKNVKVTFKRDRVPAKKRLYRCIDAHFRNFAI